MNDKTENISIEATVEFDGKRQRREITDFSKWIVKGFYSAILVKNHF